MYGRWANASTGNDKIIAVAHTSHCLNDFALIVCDHFNALQLNAEGEAELGEEGRVGVDGLGIIGKQSVLVKTKVGMYDASKGRKATE